MLIEKEILLGAVDASPNDKPAKSDPSARGEPAGKRLPVYYARASATLSKWISPSMLDMMKSTALPNLPSETVLMSCTYRVLPNISLRGQLARRSRSHELANASRCRSRHRRNIWQHLFRGFAIVAHAEDRFIQQGRRRCKFDQNLCAALDHFPPELNNQIAIRDYIVLGGRRLQNYRCIRTDEKQVPRLQN